MARSIKKFFDWSSGPVCSIVLILFHAFCFLKVMVVRDIKQDLGYQGYHGHKSWRNVSRVYLLNI